MAITGASDEIIVGGAYNSGGPPPGAYRVVVQDSALKVASTGTQQLQLTFYGKSDPDHPTKEGKFVAMMFQTLPSAKQDDEKRKNTQGFLKRLCYDGFELEWPKAGKKFDPRLFTNKEGWILLKKDEKDEQGRMKVVAIAKSKDLLPKQKEASAPATTKPSKAAATNR